MSSPPAGPQPGLSFGSKLKLLFDTVTPDPTDERRKNRRKSAFSDEELAEHIRLRTGKPCSVNQIGKWKNERSEPPSIPVAEAIAEFFGVTPLYFFDDERSVALMEQLRWLPDVAGLKQLGNRGEITVLLREISSMQPREVSALLSVVQALRQADAARAEPGALPGDADQ